MCFLRTQSYYSFMSSNINLFATIILLLRTYGVKIHSIVYIVCGIVFVLLNLIFGHLDMKWGLFKIENEIANEHNLQIMDIQKMLKDKEEKK